VIFILEPSEPGQGGDRQARNRIRLSRWPACDPLQRCHNQLAYRTFDKVRQVDQSAITDNKRLGPVLAP
jgi:hypothetical protein